MIVVKKKGETTEEALKRTLEEKRKADNIYQQPKSSDDKIGFFEIVIAIVEKGNKIECYKDYVCDMDAVCAGKWNTLGKICQNLGISIKDSRIITIILERGLDGEIWQYGNYCDGKWYYHGETRGYA